MHTIGMAIGLVSVSSFFLALIVAYFLRMQSDPLPSPIRVPRLLWISTGVLLASSLTLELARVALWRARVPQYVARLHWTLALGLAFLILQLLSWQDLIAQGVYVRGNPHGSVFFVFTGAHGVHLLGGIVALIQRAYRARRLDAEVENALRRHRRITGVIALYWHFMGALWLVLFALLLAWS